MCVRDGHVFVYNKRSPGIGQHINTEHIDCLKSVKILALYEANVSHTISSTKRTCVQKRHTNCRTFRFYKKKKLNFPFQIHLVETAEKMVGIVSLVH